MDILTTLEALILKKGTEMSKIQRESFRLFLPVTFYVKSIFRITEVNGNCHFAIFETLKFDFDDFLQFL